MSFPTSLILNEKQTDAAQAFMDSFPKNADDGDCCGTSDYTFEVIASGIGDSVFIKRGESRLYLDDGLEA